MSVKKTFAEIQAETEAARHNSNLQNLATASVRIKEELDRLEAQKAHLIALQKEIEEAGNNPEKLTHDRTKELYQRVMGSRYNY